jgi:hypothetical protein
MKAKDVFTPGSLPTVTFVSDHIRDKQKALSDALEIGSVVITVSGPSKSGKTVFVENQVGKDNLLHVTGAGVDNPVVLWKRVFDLIGTPLESTETKETSIEGSIEGKASGEIGLILKGKAEVGLESAIGKKDTVAVKVQFDPLHLLKRELGGSDFVLFIDDFHYITLEAQREVAEQIKEAIRNGVKVICASVPYHADDVIRANPDLRGRTVNIDLDFWDHDTLSKIASKGFAELGIRADTDLIRELAVESAGSPQLMQALCLHSCFELDIREKRPTEVHLPYSRDFIAKVATRTSLMVDYSSVINKLREGPKTRGEERKQFMLKDGSQADVYPILLKALAIDPPELTFRYPNLINRIQSVCTAETPSGSSVTGACNQIAKLAGDTSKEFIIEWDSSSDVLDIRDPYLLFYLRWSDK